MRKSLKYSENQLQYNKMLPVKMTACMHKHFSDWRTDEQLTVGTTVMKNCEPLEAGPALAILSVYGRSCLSVEWNSSSNSPPQMLSPPMPVPVGSPVWIMKPCKQQRTEGFWWAESCLDLLHRGPGQQPYFNDSVEYMVIVVAIPAVDTEVLHSFGASTMTKDNS